MRDYAALEALAAQSPHLNDMRITTPKGTLSMRSDFGLWLKRDSPQIGKPETDSMLVEVPGADFLLDLTRSVDGSVHHKNRKISMEFVCDRPKTQWAYIRSRLEALLQGQWLRFYFTRDGEVWAGQLDVEMTPGEYKASGRLSPFTLDGEGSVSSAGGRMYGFKEYQSIINTIAALHGNKGIAYANAKIPFANDIEKLTLRDGTVINAEKGDGIYQYIKANGTFAYAGNLNINVDGSINAMLVNTAASTLSGAMAAGGAAALLTGGAGSIAGLIGGGIAGASKSWGVNDFRNLTFHIGGTVDDPKIGSFKVNGKTWDAKEAQQENAKVTDVKDQAKNAVEKAKEDAVNKLTEKLTGKSGAESGSSKNSVRDQLNDALNKELEKGLNSLFGK